MVAWAGERLLYTASSANDLALFVLQPDEGTSEEIVPIAAGAAATADGRSIVYVSQAEATAGWIFKADADGRRSTPLVRDVVAWARLTRDGRVVFESRRGDGRPRAWVVPIDGGTPTPVTDIETLAPDVSPDGRRLAFISLNAASELEIVVCDFPGCDAQRRFMPAGLLDPSVRGSTVRFTPDGAGIAYASFDGQPNVWVQPLDGSAPRQLTTFTDGRNIYDFAWSRDGERLAVAHGSFSTDIVLFSGLGATQER
jgi:Tol biopolymer transport system component